MARVFLDDVAVQDGGLAVGAAAPLAPGVVSSVKAPPGTASYGLLSLGSGPFDGASAGKFVGSSSGTAVAANAASGYTGNLMDLQLAGSSKFKVDSTGVLTLASRVDTPGMVRSTGATAPAASGSGAEMFFNAGSALFIGYNRSSSTYAPASVEGNSLHLNQFSTGLVIAHQPIQAIPAVVTANYGILSIGAGSFDGGSAGHFAGSGSGTIIAANAPSGFSGSLLDLQLNGVSKFSVTSAGAVITAGTLKIGSRPAFVAADKYLVVDSSGNVHVSAIGPAS